jgi:hypothetical protein
MSPAVLVAALVLLSACLRFVAARTVPSPWIAPDEMLYALLGRGLGDHLRLQVLDGRPGFYSLVTPALLALPLKLGDTGTAYTAAKVVQAAVMSLAAVPVYLWGRTLMRPRWAVLAALLTLAVPGLVYTSTLMTEVAFYPATVLAAWATARAIDRPTTRRHVQLAAALALAVGIRLQAIVLLPAALTAVGLAALFARDLRRVRVHWPLVAAAALFVLIGAVAGATALGGYSVVGTGSYHPGEAAEFVAYHAAGLLLLTGVVPCVALALLAVAASRRRLDAAAQTVVAVVASFAAWTVVEVGIFVSRFSDGIGERYLLGLAPLLFLALGLWLDRGAPRTFVAGAAVALGAAALLVVVPYERFATIDQVQDSMTFSAVVPFLQAHPGLDPLLLVGLPAVALAAGAALLPRRGLPLLAAVLLVAFVAGSAAATAEVRSLSRAAQERLVGTDARWIDKAADGPVAYVFGGGPLFTAAWLNPFWNDRITGVYDLPGTHVRGPMPQERLELRGDGILRVDGAPIRARYAVLPSGYAADGEVVATATLVDADTAERVLWRFRDAPRLLEQRGGFQPNGDVPYRAEVREFACSRGGTFTVTLIGKTEQTVRLLANGELAQTVSIAGAGDNPTVYVPAMPGPRGDCVLAIVPSTLVGTTTIDFGRG